MCGIVGIVSNNDCIKDIVYGLRALEYRGYDSSGIAILNDNILSYQKNLKRSLMSRLRVKKKRLSN